MATQADIQNILSIIDRLDLNKVANLAYTEKAFNDDDIEGNNTFNIEAENNIPDALHTNYNQTVLDRGARTQASSIPRNGFNHFFGRTSYNLNKSIQKLTELLQHIMSASAHNCFEYDAQARYKQGDVCYIVRTTDEQKTLEIYQRVYNNPLELQGVLPSSDSIQWSPIIQSTSNLRAIQAQLDSLSSRFNTFSRFVLERLGLLGWTRTLVTKDGRVLITKDGRRLITAK